MACPAPIGEHNGPLTTRNTRARANYSFDALCQTHRRSILPISNSELHRIGLHLRKGDSHKAYGLVLESSLANRGKKSRQDWHLAGQIIKTDLRRIIKRARLAQDTHLPTRSSLVDNLWKLQNRS